jgi:hypothetical protein
MIAEKAEVIIKHFRRHPEYNAIIRSPKALMNSTLKPERAKGNAAATIY